MTHKTLARLEALLRVAQPGSGASIHERHMAIGEALRVVVALREPSGVDVEWVEAVAMRFEACATCGEDVRPAQRAVRNGPRWRHLACT